MAVNIGHFDELQSVMNLSMKLNIRSSIFSDIKFFNIESHDKNMLISCIKIYILFTFERGGVTALFLLANYFLCSSKDTVEPYYLDSFL